MEEIKLGALLKVIPMESRIEINDTNFEILVPLKRVDELLLENDKEIMNLEVLSVNPTHNQRENYIEIMVY